MKNKCPECGGKGTYWKVSSNYPNGTEYECQLCHGTGLAPQDEDEDEEIRKAFEKKWHGVFDHLDEMLLIEITDVFRSGFKSGDLACKAKMEEEIDKSKLTNRKLNTDRNSLIKDKIVLQQQIESMKEDIRSILDDESGNIFDDLYKLLSRLESK